MGKKNRRLKLLCRSCGHEFKRRHRNCPECGKPFNFKKARRAFLEKLNREKNGIRI